MAKAIKEADVMKALEPFSKALSTGVKQIWKMFVMRYVAKGISEVFLAAVICYFGQPWLLLKHPNEWWKWIIVAVAGILVYDAIQLLINPYYFAMNDVAMRLKSEKLLWKK